MKHPLAGTALLLAALAGAACAPGAQAAGSSRPVASRASTPPSGYSPMWQDQIVYVLIPSKFFDADPANDYMKRAYRLPNPRYEGGFLGGDIAGIRRKMGYVKGLDVSSVLLYPMFRNDARLVGGKYLATGYRVRDYQTIDPNFGTNAEFRRMMAEFHRKPRVNVIADLPIAMTGLEHPWYLHPSSYRWYYRPWNSADTSENIGTRPITMPYGPVDSDWGMPIINHTQGMASGTSTYHELRDNIVFWLVDHFGFDGFRYDSAQDFEATFWNRLMRDFRGRYRRSRHGFIQFGEVVIRPKPRPWQVPPEAFMNRDVSNPAGPIRMDGIYDIGLIRAIQDVFARGQSATRLVDHINQQAKYYEHPEKMAASVDFYEDPTFIQQVRGGHARQKILLAAAFLLTVNRVPFVYSGNEYGIDYKRPGALFGRGLDAGYQARFKRLIRIRRENAAFRRGSLEWLDVTSSVISYKREYRGKKFVVILNNDDHPGSVTIDLGSRRIACHRAENLLRPHDARVHLRDPGTRRASLSVSLDAWEAKVVRCE